ncbi:hypothetical protein J2X54_004659 [Duganella sp. 3397]|uniref:Uncharacterized protein n=1 Tax=Duganella phyllosphaerae TaxID=762836 RepID=A0A1E7X7T2_9BURK|nr:MULTISPECIES: hypothetical protein [Duganella]MDR7052157.1 hypothetical protein [Duganella sp. 3397]OFA09203.1 hypothetical protein DUPY_00920 [Duganella phyllosphaerae]
MDNVHDILDRAFNAHSAGQFDAALQDYTWLFDATSERDSDVAPLRLSYVLNAWAKLAEEYLPARQALVALRERDSERLLAGDGSDIEGDSVLFNDVRAINDKLGDAQHTYQLFQRLPASLARECANSALPSMMACGDFTLAHTYLPHPDAHLGDYAAEVSAHVATLDLLSDAGMSELLATVYNYMTEVRLILELLEGYGDHAAATRLRQQAAALVTSAEARACIDAEFAHPGTTLDAMVELQNAALI